jgi:hypothetical protein
LANFQVNHFNYIMTFLACKIINILYIEIVLDLQLRIHLKLTCPAIELIHQGADFAILTRFILVCITTTRRKASNRGKKFLNKFGQTQDRFFLCYEMASRSQFSSDECLEAATFISCKNFKVSEIELELKLKPNEINWRKRKILRNEMTA